MQSKFFESIKESSENPYKNSFQSESFFQSDFPRATQKPCDLKGFPWLFAHFRKDLFPDQKYFSINQAIFRESLQKSLFNQKYFQAGIIFPFKNMFNKKFRLISANL